MIEYITDLFVNTIEFCFVNAWRCSEAVTKLQSIVGIPELALQDAVPAIGKDSEVSSVRPMQYIHPVLASRSR